MPADDMAERLALGDYTGALAVADDILAREPDHTAAAATADTCRAVLRKMYAARIGPLDRVPNVTVARDQMRWLSIDHRAGFVLSLVDGVSTVEMILDVSGMPTLDALRILSELVQQRIITFR
jgi:flagellar basal body P-ring protein FlgI